MNMRSHPIRFTVNSDENGTYVYDDDFGWDAMLKIGGDFGSLAARNAFAEAIAKALNDAGDAIPTEASFSGQTELKHE